MDHNFDFHGAKAAFFVEDLLLAYRRDNVSEIPFSNMWDLPSGGRENDESGAESIARETFEKFGIRVDISDFNSSSAMIIGEVRASRRCFLLDSSLLNR